MSLSSEAFMLSPDVKIVEISTLSEKMRRRIDGDEDDFIISRKGSRVGSKVISASVAQLLDLFAEPKTITEAIVISSLRTQSDPEKLLESSYPMLRRFVNERLLVPRGASVAKPLEPFLRTRQAMAGYTVIACLQVLDDTEVYQARHARFGKVAIKLEGRASSAATRRRLEREAAILQHVKKPVAPAFIEAGTFRERDFIAMAWCHGQTISRLADRLRNDRDSESQLKLGQLCQNTLRCYARLHEKGVVHGDVHPRNALVDDTGAVTLIDFGHAHAAFTASSLGPPERAGVAFFFDPDYARARRLRRKAPQPTEKSDQYAIAALLYLLLTGSHYRDFPLGKKELLKEIEQKPPLPFTVRSRPAWPEVEGVLNRGLEKDEKRRFPSVRAFGEAFSRALRTSWPEQKEQGARLKMQELDGLRSRILDPLGLNGKRIGQGISSVPSASVNFGAAGVALACYRISQLAHHPEWLAAADIWATRAASELAQGKAIYAEEAEVTPETVGRISLYHTASGIHCVRALVSHARGDFVSMQEAIDEFITSASQPCSNLDLTLGRCGILLGCSLLLDAMPESPLVNGDLILKFGKSVAGEIWERLDASQPIPDQHDLEFLGIAHGWAGFLYATIAWMRSSGEPAPAGLQERLEQLASCHEKTDRGIRWPIKLHQGQPGYMPGWCNGSAGHVFLWSSACEAFGESRWGELAEGAAWDALHNTSTLAICVAD